MLSLRAISNFNEFLGLLISSLNNLYVLFLPQHWDMEGRERHDCVAYLSISRYWLDVERNKKEKFACVCKNKIIHHHWWLSMLTHMLLHVCVYLWVVDIYTNLYVLYTYGSLCIFIYIFFKNTDGFINISRIHFFHLEKQQQEKQHLMMNMYTFSRHAAFLHPYMRTNFT